MILVTLGVTVAAFAVGELLLSLPATRIPVAEARELLDEAIRGLDEKERKKEVLEQVKVFQLAHVSQGVTFSPSAYLLSLPDKRRQAVIADRQRVALLREDLDQRSLVRRLISHVGLVGLDFDELVSALDLVTDLNDRLLIQTGILVGSDELDQVVDIDTSAGLINLVFINLAG